jgi:DNA helicase-2/ATP-dependent DNA helicase PcrA
MPWKIIPREDQKQVVEYRGGKAAVNAVPGAGKTTVLIALLIELLKNKTLPSEIFVVTYMESAATNIREKIKLAIPDLTELPNVSTIHGLKKIIITQS